MAATLLFPIFVLICLAMMEQDAVGFGRVKRATTTNMCPNNNATNIDDNARKLVIDVHNRRRTVAARGQVKNGKNNYNCPQAANMMEMVYDCDLEADAQTVADDCSLNLTPEGKRTDGELVFVVNGKLNTLGGASVALSRATDNWWGEIVKNGINQKMQYVPYFANKADSPKSFTQMAWAESSKIGCGIGNCNSKIFVVCRYRDKGNVIGQSVWKIGKPCSSCANGCSSGGYLCAN